MQNLPFLQDPRRFLQSYFWGCNQGYKLSSRCRQKLDDIAAAEGAVPEFEREDLMESLLDCYVHTKACPRCEPLDNVACQRGYELTRERDLALDEAVAMGVAGRSPASGLDDQFTAEQLQAIFNQAFAEQRLLQHQRSCEACGAKHPQGRYSIAAWNIETARARQTE